MARIPLSAGFQVCPEGEYVFTVTECKYDEEFGKLTVSLKCDKGSIEKKYNLMTATGEINTPAQNAFSYLARNAMQNWDIEDLDPADLVGKQIKATVTHDKRPSTKDPSKTVTFANLDTIEPWGEPPAGALDLDALLD